MLVIYVCINMAGASAQTYYASPLRFGAGPEIGGDEEFALEMQTALDYLKVNNPDNHTSTCFWLIEIRPTETYTRVSSDGICYVTPRDAATQSAWLAGILIHEARHVEDGNTYFHEHLYSGEESEKRALDYQASYLASVYGWTQAQADQWTGYWLATKYWETIPAIYEAE